MPRQRFAEKCDCGEPLEHEEVPVTRDLYASDYWHCAACEDVVWIRLRAGCKWNMAGRDTSNRQKPRRR